MAKLDASVWKGIDRTSMLACLESNPTRRGADGLVHWFKSQQIPCIGISTGLSLFNEITRQELALDEVVLSNDLEFAGDTCTGNVVINVEEYQKAEILKQVLMRYGIDGGGVVAFGDSQADIAMFELASLAVAVFPTSTEIRDSADLVIDLEPIDRICDRLASMCG